MPNFRISRFGVCFLYLMTSVTALANNDSSFYLEQDVFLPIETVDIEYKTSLYDLYVYKQQEKVYQDRIIELKFALQDVANLAQDDIDLSNTAMSIQEQIEHDEVNLQRIQKLIQQAKGYLVAHPQQALQIELSEDLSLKLLLVYEQRIEQLDRIIEPFSEQLDRLDEQLDTLLNQPESEIDEALYHELNLRTSEIYHQYKPISAQRTQLALKVHDLKMHFDPIYRRRSVAFIKELETAFE